MGNDYQDNRKKLGAMLKSEPSQTPIQEVRPVEPVTKAKAKSNKEASKPDEEYINFWAPAELVQWVKIHSVTSKKSIKQVCIEALEAYRQTIK